MSPGFEKIGDILLRHAKEAKENYEAPWLNQKPLSMKNANKFFLGAIIDYKIKANAAWDNARRLSEKVLGDPPKLWDHIVNSYTREEWASKWRVFRLHRFPAAHDRIWRIGHDIVKRYDGDVRNIWQGKNTDAVLSALESMRCGRKISDMIVGWLINYRLLGGTGDVAADTHICTVLGRIFYANPDLETESARQLARSIHPDNPWELDVALYDIGQKYCDWCYCDDCPIGKEDECEDYRRYKSNKP